MQQFQFNPLMYEVYKRQHAELIKQAEQFRLANEASHSSNPEATGRSKFLAMIGKELSSLGFSLEVRFGAQLEPYTSLNQQSNPGDCA